ncbi:hypothetical protein BVRB_7g161450 [Beta vulgaris subsp. vulgaris]|nr:hypothetical protein BVRB_7g161450 [Beta vulgaris subsp. vulgaris]
MDMSSRSEDMVWVNQEKGCATVVSLLLVSWTPKIMKKV